MGLTGHQKGRQQQADKSHTCPLRALPLRAWSATMDSARHRKGAYITPAGDMARITPICVTAYANTSRYIPVRS